MFFDIDVESLNRREADHALPVKRASAAGICGGASAWQRALHFGILCEILHASFTGIGALRSLRSGFCTTGCICGLWLFCGKIASAASVNICACVPIKMW